MTARVAVDQPRRVLSAASPRGCGDRHCRNILEPNFVNIGTGIVGTEFTEDFGTPLSSRPMDQNWRPANAVCG
jgi:hypothetical protein